MGFLRSSGRQRYIVRSIDSLEALSGTVSKVIMPGNPHCACLATAVTFASMSNRVLYRRRSIVDRSHTALGLACICIIGMQGVTAAFAATQSAGDLIRSGEELRISGQYKKAKQAIEAALKILEQSKDCDATRLSGAYNYLSLVENHEGRYADSELHARRALEIAKQADLGESVLAMHSVVLANALRQQQKYREAENVLLPAVETLRRCGANRALIGTAENNLGALYFWTGDYAKATEWLKTGLQTRIQALGDNHADVANSLLDLGATEFKLGDINAAEEHVSKSVEIRKEKFGAKHDETLASQATLAVIWEAQGKTRQAADLLATVVRNARLALGSEHPDTAQYLDDYANVLSALRSYPQARRAQQSAMRIRQRVYGETSREVGASLRSLAHIEAESGNTSEAGSLLKRSAAIYKNAGQHGDPDYADTLDELGAYYVSAGDLPAARDAFTESVTVRAAGGASVSYAIALANLADVLRRLNLAHESLETLRKSASVIDALPASLRESPDCASILRRLKEQAGVSP